MILKPESNRSLKPSLENNSSTLSQLSDQIQLFQTCNYSKMLE